MANTRDRSGEKAVMAGRTIARLAFLYGEGDGKPVADVKRLSELSGLAVLTLKRWMPEWNKEREEMLTTNGKCALGYHLSKETIQSHKEDVAFLRSNCNNLKNESDSLDKILPKMEKMFREIPDSLCFGADDAQEIIDLMKAYFKTSLNQQKVLGLFLSVQKRWQESSGMQSQLKAWEVGQREQARGLARVESKRQEVELLKDEKLELVAGQTVGVFARRKKA